MIEINIFSSILLVVLFLLLFFRKKNALPNKILALILLDPSLNFINNIVILSGLIYSFPWSYFFVQITGALFGPLTYYYIFLMTNSPIPKQFKWLRAVTVLLVLFGVGIMVNFMWLSPEGKSAYLEGLMQGPYPTDMVVYAAVLFTHQLLYVTSNAVHVRNYQRQIKATMSDIDQVKIKYLYRFVGLLWVLTFITVVLYLTINAVYVEYIALPVVMVIILFFVLYYAINEHAIFTFQEYEAHLQKIDISIRIEPISEGLEAADEVQEDKIEKLIVLIEEKELYRNSELTIKEVAEKMELPAYKLAQLIKEGGTTFYELIRKIRVEHAKEMLLDENCTYSIEAIAYEVGFNSRASFYRAFKKYENKNPSDYSRIKA